MNPQTIALTLEIRSALLASRESLITDTKPATDDRERFYSVAPNSEEVS